ncbi:synaptotagmin-11-like isoform X1 [Peromyscus californicus insignis]|uniref:synaptotagmin-11-like isoform X1 n=1 Tax=Peromyscus californicus insignis TaxID=564181 RepID=UPI0022A7A693|nr:synaptotagmin-11-like isoform X1 [Peromyscus californicus insignis]
MAEITNIRPSFGHTHAKCAEVRGRAGGVVFHHVGAASREHCVLRKTLDPVFDETFTFYGIPYSQLQDLVLHFLVLSFDRFSRDDVIGEVMVPLAGVDPSTGRVQLIRDIFKRNIQARLSLL